jgi:hypothetical protein
MWLLNEGTCSLIDCCALQACGCIMNKLECNELHSMQACGIQMKGIAIKGIAA